jgi:hypothetical protein
MTASDPRAALDFFCGTWTLAGQEPVYTEVCEWLPGRGFVACRSEDRSGPWREAAAFEYLRVEPRP